MNQPLNLVNQVLRVHLQHAGKIDLPLTDLMFLQATGNYCWLHWKGGQRILIPRPLKYYEPKLPDGWFVRPHRNCIVNVRYIKRMEQIAPDQGGLVYLRSGDVLPVSRRRWVATKRLLKRLLADSYTQTGQA